MCPFEDRFIFILKKIKHPVHIMVSVLKMLTLYHYLSSAMASVLIWRPTSSSWRRWWGPGSRAWLLENPTSSNWTMCHAKQEEEPTVGCKKYNVTLSLTSACKHSHIAIPLLLMGHGCVRDQQNSVKHQRWTQGKDKGNIYRFKQGDSPKGWQEILS